MRHWANPRYWRWLWHHRIGRGAKAFLVTVVALLAATGGYASARSLVPEEQGDVFVERVVTLIHKEPVPGSDRVVTVRQTVTTREPQKTRIVTVDGKTITVRPPTQTIAGPTVTTRGKTKIVKLPGKTKYRTIKVAGQTRTVVDKRTDTIVRTDTIERSNTITAPGETVSRTETIEREGPTRTVINDRTITNERTVTGPTSTVTVTGPTQTVTGPTQTVTHTDTVTRTVTSPADTVTVTVTQPPAGTGP